MTSQPVSLFIVKAIDGLIPFEVESKPVAGSSWLGWLWKRGDSQSGSVIQAKLGEEKSSFYYDKELKRWVNSKVRVTDPSVR